MISKNEAWHQSRTSNERRVAADDLADFVAGNEYTLETVEPCGDANLGGIGFAKVHAHLGVVVNEGCQL